MRKGDVLVVFDYRRYQSDTIESARVASLEGSHVILFTDPWLSPASGFARQVIVTSGDMVGPFDSLVGAMAVVEGVVAAVLGRLGPRAQSRMETLERLRAGDVLAGADQPAVHLGPHLLGDDMRIDGVLEDGGPNEQDQFGPGPQPVLMGECVADAGD